MPVLELGLVVHAAPRFGVASAATGLAVVVVVADARQTDAVYLLAC